MELLKKKYKNISKSSLQMFINIKNMDVYEVNFEENPEEYMEVIRAIKNLEVMFFGGSPLLDDIRFYDPQPEADLGYESGNESDIEIINEPDDSSLSASTSCENLDRAAHALLENVNNLGNESDQGTENR